MAREPASPVSFRLAPEDKLLVETVAAFRGQTVSEFVRNVVIEVAAGVVRNEGRDKILKSLEESNERQSEERAELYRRAVDKAASSRS